MEYTAEKTRRRQVPSMGRLSLYSVEWVHEATRADKRRSACVGTLLHLLGEHFMQGHISTINSFEILSALIHTLCVRGAAQEGFGQLSLEHSAVSPKGTRETCLFGLPIHCLENQRGTIVGWG